MSGIFFYNAPRFDYVGEIKSGPTRVDNPTWKNIDWSESLGLFVAICNRTIIYPEIVTSPDGVTWTEQSGPATTDNTTGHQKVFWSGSPTNLFIVLGKDSIHTSSDGENWIARACPSLGEESQSAAFEGIDYNPTNQLFVAGGTGALAGEWKWIYSTGGINWTGVTAGQPATKGTRMAYSSSLDLWIAVVEASALPGTYYSTTGTTWFINPNSNAIIRRRAVEWSAELGIFVNVGTDHIETSTDGLIWTVRTSPAVEQWDSLVWCPGRGEFWALANTTAMSSPDGIDWVERPLPAGTWVDISWSEGLGKVCICGNDNQFLLI
jgi:hypothetical protein